MKLIALFLTILATMPVFLQPETLGGDFTTVQSRFVKKIQEETVNVAPFLNFWAKLRAEVSAKKIDLSKDYRLQIAGNFPNGKISEGDISFNLNHNQSELLELLKDFLLAVDDSKLFRIVALTKFDEKIDGADLQIQFLESDVNFKLILQTNSENSAERITTRFKTLFSVTAWAMKEDIVGEFYKTADISAEKDRIFVNGKIKRTDLEKYLSYEAKPRKNS